jgi:hypothetical protein
MSAIMQLFLANLINLETRVELKLLMSDVKTEKCIMLESGE